MNVGLVENNMQFAELLREGLVISGNTVHIYPTARECIDAIVNAKREQLPLPHDTVMIGVDLGGAIEGSELIRHIREHVSKEELPFLLLSGTCLTEQILLGKQFLDLRQIGKYQQFATRLQKARQTPDTHRTEEIHP